MCAEINAQYINASLTKNLIVIIAGSIIKKHSYFAIVKLTMPVFRDHSTSARYLKIIHTEVTLNRCGPHESRCAFPFLLSAAGRSFR